MQKSKKLKPGIELLESRRLLSGTSPGIVWQTEAASPLTRAEGSKAVVNNKLYVMGGFTDADLNVTKELDVYDPATNTWKRLADVPVPETHGGTAVVGDDIYLGGFFYNNGVTPSTLVYMYNIDKNTWTQEPSIPLARGSMGMTAVGSVLHIWGGLTAQTTSAADHWALDLNNISAGWVSKAPLPQALDHLGSVTVNGKIWSMGGLFNKEETSGNRSAVYSYDPATNKWTTEKPLPEGVGHISPDTTVAGDKIIIAGGEINASHEEDVSTVVQYDTTTGLSTELTSLPQGRKSADCGFADGKLIVTCGNTINSPYVSNITWVASYNPNGTALTQLKGTTIGTSGSYSSQGNTIAKATDGSLSTFFDGPTANGNWVGLDLGSALTITQIEYAPRSGFTSRMVGGEFQISTTANFSSGVTTIATITTAPAAGSLTTITLSTPVTARYIRYLSPTGSYGNISEFQVFGTD